MLVLWIAAGNTYVWCYGVRFAPHEATLSPNATKSEHILRYVATQKQTRERTYDTILPSAAGYQVSYIYRMIQTYIFIILRSCWLLVQPTPGIKTSNCWCVGFEFTAPKKESGERKRKVCMYYCSPSIYVLSTYSRCIYTISNEGNKPQEALLAKTSHQCWCHNKPPMLVPWATNVGATDGTTYTLGSRTYSYQIPRYFHTGMEHTTGCGGTTTVS